MAKDWLSIRIKTNQRDINAVRLKIETWPEEVFVKNYFQKLQSLAAQAANMIRQIIHESYTRTGIQRYADGEGEPGRIDSGKMLEAVSWKVTKVGEKRYQVLIGWLDGEPGYTIFQEYGTSNGVVGMNATMQAQVWFQEQVHALRGGTKVATSRFRDA